MNNRIANYDVIFTWTDCQTDRPTESAFETMGVFSISRGMNFTDDGEVLKREMAKTG
jgi:hypothetical protein